jgi:hypothetical protein
MAYRRIEVRIGEGDDLLTELTGEAIQRGVTLPQHVYDLLRGRYLARRGQTLSDLLWVPGVPPPPASVVLDLVPEKANGAATAAAGAWLDMLDDG